MMSMWRGINPWESQTFVDDQGAEDLWGYVGAMGPQQPASPAAPVAPVAPAVQQQNQQFDLRSMEPMEQMAAMDGATYTPPPPPEPPVDPYAAIRFFPEPVASPLYRPINEDEWIYENTWEGSGRVAPEGAVQIPGPEGDLGWAMQSGSTYSAPWDTLKPAGFESKYNAISMLDDGRMAVTLQQPGAHKYDTMTAIYGRDPQSNQWTLQNDPMQAKSRQISTGESFFRDPLEQFGKDFVLPAAAMYTGAKFLAPYAEALTAALEGGSQVVSGMDLAADGGGNALWQTGAEGGMDLAADGGGNALWQTGTEGGTKTLADTLPEVMAAQPGIPASGIAPVTPPAPLPALPSLKSAAPSLLDTLKSFGGSAMDWIKQNPKLARGLFTAAGGLAGGVSSQTGGATQTPQTFGPPQAWTSGLTMGGGQSSAPRQRAPVIDYTLPSSGGLSMGAGRFLGRGG